MAPREAQARGVAKILAPSATPGIDYTLAYVDDAGSRLKGHTVLTVTSVPEPSSLALLAGMAVMGVIYCRRRKGVGAAGWHANASVGMFVAMLGMTPASFLACREAATQHSPGLRRSRYPGSRAAPSAYQP